MKAGEQAWLLTGPQGSHEFSRLYWCGTREDATPQYRVVDGRNRVGQLTLEHVAIDQQGAWLTWSGGFKSQIPGSWYQLTWR